MAGSVAASASKGAAPVSWRLALAGGAEFVVASGASFIKEAAMTAPFDTHIPLPIPDSYWVQPRKLLAGEYPGARSRYEARQKLARFLRAGITYFLDLTEEGELAPYADLLAEEASAAGVAVTRYRAPIPDLGTPTEAQVAAILDRIDAAVAAGDRVYVHCWGGIGRTGTIVGCYLVRHGLTGEQALAEIARLRCRTPDAARPSPETPEQWERVRQWRPGA
jgi:protein-tyrosine phosphatase